MRTRCQSDVKRMGNSYIEPAFFVKGVPCEHMESETDAKLHAIFGRKHFKVRPMRN